MTVSRQVPRLSLHPALPRLLHPAAWWLWGAGMAVAASRTTNPFLLVLIALVVVWVVLERREPGMANPLLPFVVVGLVAIVLRVVMVSLLGDGVPGRVVLFTLPQLPLPDWATGIRLGGPVTWEAVLSAVYAGGRLAAVLVCFGAANALASPRRLLRYCPPRSTRSAPGGRGAHLRPAAGRRRRAGSTTARRLRGHAGHRAAEPVPATPCRCWRRRWTARWTLAASMDVPWLRPRRAPYSGARRRLTSASQLAGLGGRAGRPLRPARPPRPARRVLGAAAARGWALATTALVVGRVRATAHAATGPTRGRCPSGWSPSRASWPPRCWSGPRFARPAGDGAECDGRPATGRRCRCWRSWSACCRLGRPASAAACVAPALPQP